MQYSNYSNWWGSSLVFLLAVVFAFFQKDKFPPTTIFWLPKSSWNSNLWLPRVQGTGHVANPPHCLQKVPRHRIRCERLSCDLGIGTACLMVKLRTPAFTNQLRLVVEISHYLQGFICAFKRWFSRRNFWTINSMVLWDFCRTDGVGGWIFCMVENTLMTRQIQKETGKKQLKNETKKNETHFFREHKSPHFAVEM